MCCNSSLLAVPSKSNFPFFGLSFPKAQHSAVAPLLCPASRRLREVPILLSPLFSKPCVSWQDLSDVLVCSSAVSEERKGERCKIGGSFSHHLLVACRQASLSRLFLGAKEKWLLWSEGCPSSCLEPSCSPTQCRRCCRTCPGQCCPDGFSTCTPCASGHWLHLRVGEEEERTRWTHEQSLPSRRGLDSLTGILQPMFSSFLLAPGWLCQLYKS